jgi:hypothetical protein
MTPDPRARARPLRMPDADPENADHNAFAQDFLSRWSDRFIGETPPDIGDRADDYDRLQAVIEMIQETYAKPEEPTPTCPRCGHDDVAMWAEDGESPDADYWLCENEACGAHGFVNQGEGDLLIRNTYIDVSGAKRYRDTEEAVR